MSQLHAKPVRPHALLPLIIVLSLACIGSAVAVVEVENQDRLAVAQLNHLRNQMDHLTMEQAQLELEQATLARRGRVERLARQQFQMIEPKHYVIVPENPLGNHLQAPAAASGSP